MAELADVQDLGSCAFRRVGSSPTDRMQANGKEEKGCRIDKQGFEAAVLSGGVPFRCQALQEKKSG